MFDREEKTVLVKKTKSRTMLCNYMSIYFAQILSRYCPFIFFLSPCRLSFAFYLIQPSVYLSPPPTVVIYEGAGG